MTVYRHNTVIIDDVCDHISEVLIKSNIGIKNISMVSSVYPLAVHAVILTHDKTLHNSTRDKIDKVLNRIEIIKKKIYTHKVPCVCLHIFIDPNNPQLSKFRLKKLLLNEPLFGGVLYDSGPIHNGVY